MKVFIMLRMKAEKKPSRFHTGKRKVQQELIASLITQSPYPWIYKRWRGDIFEPEILISIVSLNLPLATMNCLRTWHVTLVATAATISYPRQQPYIQARMRDWEGSKGKRERIQKCPEKSRPENPDRPGKDRETVGGNTPQRKKTRAGGTQEGSAGFRTGSFCKCN